MIIITGPGRSGTSVGARLYKELGFEIGGHWKTSVNAGLEARDIVNINQSIIQDLGIENLLLRNLWYQLPPTVSHLGLSMKKIIPALFRHVSKSILAKTLALSNSKRQARPLKWENFFKAVRKYKPVLENISQKHEVVKDPLFCWTLPVWAEAGVEIEHVLVCIRHTDSMVKSRFNAGHLLTKSFGDAKNSMIYGLGLCIATLYDYNISYSIVRYPDFLKDPEFLFASMKFPKPITWPKFLEVFNSVVDLSKVHLK
ncbi:hypothetical protein DBT_1985 [Dissulfuribacter thermophilus]|uniref:Sulfotransferase family protein n=1 Tax=Dissulfuribacter thermophilus TaxID=1156395 RepID=A0A1B9F418_9BACT|nr:hypothetical protein [Dissulfuribacter thermophilus]OCC14670.1 hypothetical protein DBT_1985 [Dissulfuribacter thermophilus]